MHNLGLIWAIFLSCHICQLLFSQCALNEACYWSQVTGCYLISLLHLDCWLCSWQQHCLYLSVTQARWVEGTQPATEAGQRHLSLSLCYCQKWDHSTAKCHNRMKSFREPHCFLSKLTWHGRRESSRSLKRVQGSLGSFLFKAKSGLANLLMSVQYVYYFSFLMERSLPQVCIRDY